MKLLFFDLETTGIKYWRNGVHQISGEIVIDGVTKESFNFNVCPHSKGCQLFPSHIHTHFLQHCAPNLISTNCSAAKQLPQFSTFNTSRHL